MNRRHESRLLKQMAFLFGAKIRIYFAILIIYFKILIFLTAFSAASIMTSPNVGWG